MGNGSYTADGFTIKPFYEFQSAYQRHGEWKVNTSTEILTVTRNYVSIRLSAAWGMEELDSPHREWRRTWFQSAYQRHGEWKLTRVQTQQNPTPDVFQSAYQRHGEWKIFFKEVSNGYGSQFQSAYQRHGEWKIITALVGTIAAIKFQSAYQRHGEWK